MNTLIITRIAPLISVLPLDYEREERRSAPAPAHTLMHNNIIMIKIRSIIIRVRD